MTKDAFFNYLSAFILIVFIVYRKEKRQILEGKTKNTSLGETMGIVVASLLVFILIHAIFTYGPSLL